MMSFRKFLFVFGLSLAFLPFGAMANSCTADVCARLVITNVQNTGSSSDMMDNVFVGQGTTSISSDEWFPIYDGGAFVADSDMADYSNVKGLSVERWAGKIRIRAYGFHTDNSQEHVEGYLELSNGKIFSIENDTVMVMDNWCPEMKVQKAGSGKDAAWIEDGKSYFWMTVEPNADTYFTFYNLAPKVTLSGNSTVHLSIGQNYVEPGYSAIDPEDGSLSVVVTGTVKENIPGTYTLRYKATDSSGVSSEVTREVTIANECASDLICAKIVVADSDYGFSDASAEFANVMFVGQKDSSISSGTWFPVYKNGAFIVDPDIADYSNVKGIAVERMEGKIRVRLYGVHTGITEHAHGYVELSGGEIFDIQNDSGVPAFQMDNWCPEMKVQKAGPGKDAAWIEGGKSYFWMTVEPASDSYYTSYRTNPATPLDFTSSLDASATVGTAFTYTLTSTNPAGSTPTFTVATSSLPAGILFDGVNTLSGTPTTAGTYDISVSVTNGVQTITKTLRITVGSANNGGGNGGGGGSNGGGGSPGSGPVLLQSVKISNATLVFSSSTPNGVTVVWNTSLPSNGMVVFGNLSHAVPGSASDKYGYNYSTPADATLSTSHSMAISGLDPKTTYYFRAVSDTGSSKAISDELVYVATQTTSTPIATTTALVIPTTITLSGGTPVAPIVNTPVINRGNIAPVISEIVAESTEEASSSEGTVSVTDRGTLRNMLGAAYGAMAGALSTHGAIIASLAFILGAGFAGRKISKKTLPIIIPLAKKKEDEKENSGIGKGDDIFPLIVPLKKKDDEEEKKK